jgi:UDP-2,3-diacylglucosamine pyrophosphatase LpxH
MKRMLDIAVISDVHLGTYSCHAAELLRYLKSIKPAILVINGDFIDMWQFREKRFPPAHLQVIQQVFQMANKGTKVYYIIGNHDEYFRQYADYSSGNIHLREKVVLQLKDKRVGIFHGDDFDLSVHYANAVTTPGEKGYQAMVFLNRLLNKLRRFLGLQPKSFVKKIKSRVKGAVRYVRNFEALAFRVAARANYDYVICGHVHRPQIRSQQIAGKEITYMNAGDWVENLTALEYRKGHWQVYEYNELDFETINKRLQVKKSGATTSIKRKLNPPTIAFPEGLLRKLDLL